MQDANLRARYCVFNFIVFNVHVSELVHAPLSIHCEGGCLINKITSRKIKGLRVIKLSILGGRNFSSSNYNDREYIMEIQAILKQYVLISEEIMKKRVYNLFCNFLEKYIKVLPLKINHNILSLFRHFNSSKINYQLIITLIRLSLILKLR